MAFQSGITVDGPGKPFTAVNNISRPLNPGSHLALVKCLAVGIHPVDSMQQQYGLLVNEWPAILGSDCAGVVLEVGPNCNKLKAGDYVYGCAPLGQNKFTPFQETFLVDERVFFKKTAEMSVEETCTIGSGLLTASLCLLAGTGLNLPEAGSKAPETDEWIVILGGTGTVGQFAVQIAHLCGYRVVASCSSSKQFIALRSGATATFNSRGTVAEQLSEIKRITGGNFCRIVDATANGYNVMVKALQDCSAARATKYLASVDDWSEFKTPPDIKEYRAELGHLCRLGDSVGVEVTDNIASWIPALEAHVKLGTLKTTEYQVLEGVGWGIVIEGIRQRQSGKATKKLVVRVQEE